MAKHVVTFIKALDLRRVDLLGFSLGGFVAQQVALENPGLIRRLVLAGTGPQGGEGMDALTPLVTERATRDTPVMEDFLYLFFSPSETSQAAGRDFWERRHTRADQDIPSSIAAMHAQAAAITQWGARQRGHHGAEHQLLYPSAAHPERHAHSLPRFRAWRALSVPRAFCFPCASLS
jgi:pimeloyl-ACP methyl ester carboxylesterase